MNSSKPFKIIIFACLFCALCSSIAAAAPNKRTFYNLTIDSENSRRLKVEASFVLRDEFLYMDEGGAAQFPKRWANFLENVKAADAKGNTLKIEELAGARWKVYAPIGKRVNLSYEVVLKHDEYEWPGGIDGVAFARDWGVFYTGRTFLILNGKRQTDVEIQFRLPKDWRVTASWRLLPGAKNVFCAANSSDLSESMFFAGRHEEISFKRKDFELVFALGGREIIAQKDVYGKLAEGVLDYYIDLMGGIPNPPPANKFKKAVVIINEGADVDGEVIGNHISLILDPLGERQTQILAKFIFAHEFFHFWNGKSIDVTSSGEEWFKEGITNYYALKALMRTGAIDEKDYFDTLSNLFYKRYAADSGFGKLSMRDVGASEKKDEHWGLIYGGGLFAGMCEDIEVRRKTANRSSLDNLMRDFFKRYGGTNKTYATADVQKYLTTLGGEDRADFFRRHVFGVREVPIEKCLANAGLNAEIEDGNLRIAVNPAANESEKAILNGILGK